MTLAVAGLGGRCPEACDSAQLQAERARLKRERARLVRPVVILSGYHAPPQVAWWVRASLASLTSGATGDFLTVSYPVETLIDRAAEAAIARVSQKWPDQEVDVVGLSMGGIVARFAALTPQERAHPTRPTAPSDKRLPVARLFTFATPHQGSIRAQLIAPDAAAKDLKPGSPFLEVLNQRSRAFELVCYAQEGDNLIASVHAAPPGETAFTAARSRLMSHFTTAHNPWFLVDLARRLRGEDPLLVRS